MIEYENKIQFENNIIEFYDYSDGNKQRMNVLSWNVLHRSHEKHYNPNSCILRAYSDDRARLDCIINVLSLHVSKETIVCLQECSGELLTLINSTFNASHDLLSQRIMSDEYLITLTPKFLKCRQDTRSIPKGANGYLSVSNSLMRIINCHLRPQFTVKDRNILSIIGQEDMNIMTIVAGDFNENSNKVKKALIHKYRIPYFGPSYKKKKGLDHIIFNRMLRYKAGIVQTELLSDHDPVILEFLP